jgi:hypothetical protein
MSNIPTPNILLALADAKLVLNIPPKLLGAADVSANQLHLLHSI